MKNRMVAFDFDGVIANSWEVVVGIAQMADPTLSEGAYRERFRGNVESTVTDLTSILGHDFFDEYEARVNEMPLFAGMAEVISSLAPNYILTIVSSTRTDILDAFLRVHNLRSYFAALYGSTEGYDKTVKLRRAIQEQGVTAQQTLFVTDTLGDLHEAAKADIATIAVSWGYHGAETLDAGSPYVTVKTPEALKGAIETFFTRGIAT